MAIEDTIAMDTERDQFFEVRTQLEDQVQKLQKRLDKTEVDEQKEKNDKITNFEKECTLKMRAKMEDHAAEVVKQKIDDLNIETENLRKREHEFKQQEKELSEKLLKTEGDLQFKDREVQTLCFLTTEDEAKLKKLRASHEDQIKILNEYLSSQKEKVSELQKEVEKTRKEGQELQRVKMMVFKENIAK